MSDYLFRRNLFIKHKSPTTTNTTPTISEYRIPQIFEYVASGILEVCPRINVIKPIKKSMASKIIFISKIESFFSFINFGGKNEKS